MTPELLRRDWLSLRYWLTRCVLPSAAILVGVLLLFRGLTDNAADLNQNALIVGFFSLYFVFVRGGHLLMVRSLHAELLRKYPEGYAEKLGYIPRGQIKRRNVGFTLARIKRELMLEEQKKKSKRLG